MAAQDQVVDISENPFATRKRRRRAILRLGIPVLGVFLVISSIVGIALYSHYANRRGVLELSDQFLTTLDRQISQRVASFLDPCARAVEILRDAALRTPPVERRAVVETLAASALQRIPQVSAFFVGGDDGDFTMVRRSKQSSGTEVKQIVNEPGIRHVFWIEKDPLGYETSRREDFADEFDPRTRPWYEGALKTDGVFWTDVYIFFTDKKPGLTASIRLKTEDAKEYVFGVDVAIDELSRFLSTLEIGETGRALIIDGKGQLVAAPDAEKLLKPSGEDFVTPRLDEIGDPVLTAAFDRFRVQGGGRRVLEVNDVSYVTSATPLMESGRDWWVLMVVPEADFTGFVTSNHQTTLAMSLVIVIAVIVLAILLFRQGLRYDRSLRRMVDRSRTISQQSAAYASIAEQAEKYVVSEGRLPPALTESLANLTAARRASIWRLDKAGYILGCEDSFDGETRGHASGLELHRREMSKFFEFLAAGQEIEIADAASDQRTQQFYRLIMQPIGSTALFILPLHRGERSIGALCLEDAKNLEGLRDFVHTVAGMAALQLHELAGPEQHHALRQARSGELRSDEPKQILPADLKMPKIDERHLGARLFPGIAVMVMQFSGPVALATKARTEGTDIADSVAQALQKEATEHGVTYLKFVSQEVVAASGLEEDAETAMARISGFAVALRDRCTSLFDSVGGGAEFRVGIHFGVAFGCVIGEDPQQFNLWGEAVETAETMASTAAPGAIQVSEAAYSRLRQDFLFRPRGTFFVPGQGESRTYVLAGQL